MWRRGCPGQCRTLACSFLRYEWRQAGLLESRMQPTALVPIAAVSKGDTVGDDEPGMAPEGSGTREVCQFTARFFFGQSVTRIRQPQVTIMYGSVVTPTFWAHVYFQAGAPAAHCGLSASCHAATRVGSLAYGRGGRTAATAPER